MIQFFCSTIRTHQRVLKFLVAGGTAAIVEYGIFLLGITLFGKTDFSEIVAHIVGFSLGFIISFTANKFWVFQHDGKTSTQLVKYIALALINLLLSTLLLQGLIWLGLHPLVAKFLVMGSVAVWNYLLLQKLIFPDQNK